MPKEDQAKTEESQAAEQRETTQRSDVERMFTADHSAAMQGARDEDVPDDDEIGQEDDGGSSSHLVAKARELGLNVPDDADLEQIVDVALGRMAEMAPYAQYGQAVLPKAAEFEEFLRSRSESGVEQPAKKTAEEEWNEDEYFKNIWQSPQWRDEYTYAIQKGIVQRDPRTGMYVAAEGFETLAAPILQGLNQAMEWTSQQWQGIVHSNPYRQFYERLREPLRRTWRQDIQDLVREELGRYRQEMEIEEYERKNASWMYKKDASGKWVPTDAGQKFIDTVQKLSQSGMRDRSTILEIAEKLCGVGQNEPVQGETKQNKDKEQAARKKEEKKTFLDDALSKTRHRPSSADFQGRESDQPGRMTEGELSNLFVSTLRASRAVH